MPAIANNQDQNMDNYYVETFQNTAKSLDMPFDIAQMSPQTTHPEPTKPGMKNISTQWIQEDQKNANKKSKNRMNANPPGQPLSINLSTAVETQILPAMTVPERAIPNNALEQTGNPNTLPAIQALLQVNGNTTSNLGADTLGNPQAMIQVQDGGAIDNMNQ